MKKFNNRGGFGDRRGGGGFNRGGQNSSRPQMHQATCAECGRPCEVPFRPTGDKPVYCSNCFKTKGGADKSKSGSRDFNRRPNFEEKKMFSATCSECGRPCEVPFRPTGDKPVYCSNCFGKNNAGQGDKFKNKPNKVSGDFAASKPTGDFSALNAKLDKILRALELIMPVQPVKAKEAIKEVKKEAAKKPARKAAAPKAAAKKKAKKK
jgi:CxxC-x17-CxxC domain-containing protein